MIKEIIGKPVTLTLQLAGRETDRYVRVQVYEQDMSAVKTTAVLVHKADGLYFVTDPVSFDEKGNWSVVFTVYTDSGYTVIDEDYGSINETVFMDDDISAIIANEDITTRGR